jgi:hypothetical protein
MLIIRLFDGQAVFDGAPGRVRSRRTPLYFYSHLARALPSFARCLRSRSKCSAISR